MIETRLLPTYPGLTFDNLSTWPTFRMPGALVNVWEIAKSFWHFLKAFQHLRYHVTQDGTVTITHAGTGSAACFRADGNMNILPTRHALLVTGGYLLLNSPEMDSQEYPGS